MPPTKYTQNYALPQKGSYIRIYMLMVTHSKLRPWPRHLAFQETLLRRKGIDSSRNKFTLANIAMQKEMFTLPKKITPRVITGGMQLVLGKQVIALQIFERLLVGWFGCKLNTFPCPKILC